MASSHSCGVGPLQQQAALEAALQPNMPSENSSQALLESLMESRFTSLERLIAMQVMFYHMAASVANFW